MRNSSKILQKLFYILSEENPPIHFLERDEYLERYYIPYDGYSIIIDIDHVDIEIIGISINKKGLLSFKLHMMDEVLCDPILSLIQNKVDCVGSNKILDDFLDPSYNVSEIDKLILEEKYEEAALLKEKIEKEKKDKEEKKIHNQNNNKKKKKKKKSGK